MINHVVPVLSEMEVKKSEIFSLPFHSKQVQHDLSSHEKFEMTHSSPISCKRDFLQDQGQLVSVSGVTITSCITD
jgi:hypothetical protein